MNKYSLFAVALIAGLLAAGTSTAQNINWSLTKASENNELAYASLGFDYSPVYTAGYSRLFKVYFPVAVGLEYSAPFGKTLFDDFKSKLGGQVELLHLGHFAASGNFWSNFRHYKSEYATIASFGCETGLTLGFYSKWWHLAAEGSFDKAIATHIKNHDIVKDNYPGIVNGWYVPTGGHYRYGLQTGVSFGRNDINISLGQIIQQHFEEGALVPYYAQIGYNRWF